MTYRLSTTESKQLCAEHNWPWDDRWLGLECKPIKRKRSTEHNALYWKIVGSLGDAIGFSKGEMHEELLAEMHGFDLVEFRGTTRKRPKGRSHNLTSEDFDKLVAIAKRWCAEMKINWEAA